MDAPDREGTRDTRTDLIAKISTASVKTMKIVDALPDLDIIDA